MAKALIKVDARNRPSLLEALSAQQSKRQQQGENGFSVCIDNNKRNIAYVMLEWKSVRSLRRFLQCPEGKEMIGSWPTQETLEVVELFDLTEDINAE
jgi:hypothetical protein